VKKDGFLAKLFSKGQTDEKKKIAQLGHEAKEMIRGIVELSDSIVREIMVPRTDAVFIALSMPREELIALVIETGYSRFPVYKDRVDNVIGILYAKDLLKYIVKGNEPFDISKIVKRPYFVPETKRLDSLLKEFKKRQVHIAVVVDEYGGTSGIVCLEDIIEEIIGEIQDEFDSETEDILKIGEEAYLCDARVNLGDLNEKLKLDLPTDDFDSLGGFVFDLFGKIPEISETVSFGNRLDFVVQRMEGRKILSVKLIIKKDENKK
jgi:CBS domain containing-hemolysin-like protein